MARARITQKEAIALRKEVASLKDRLTDAAKVAEAAERRTREFEQRAATQGATLASSKVRLGDKQRIARWDGAPVEVREAIKVAQHLGMAVLVACVEDRADYYSTKTVPVGEQTPPGVDYIAIYARPVVGGEL